MRAAVVRRANHMEVADFPVPRVTADGQVVVRMLRASICGSDVHSLFHGFLNPDGVGRPGYPGHEGVGEVVESSAPDVPAGTRVLTVPVGNIGGCFAEYQLLDAGQVVPLPPDGDLARLLMAQQYGTTLYAMRLFWPTPGNTGMTNRTCGIIGAGSAGLFFLQQALGMGFDQVIVSDRNRKRLAVARSLGATTTVHAPAESFSAVVLEATDGAGADLVIEAAGYDACRADAVQAVRVLGTVGFFGFPQQTGMASFPMFEAFRRIARLQWAGGTQQEPGLLAFRDAIRHIHEGVITVDYCLGPVYGLEQIPEAMAVARDDGLGAVKISIDLAPGDGA